MICLYMLNYAYILKTRKENQIKLVEDVVKS